MKVKKNTIASVVVLTLCAAFAHYGTARFVVNVIDDQINQPIPDVNVIACFTSRYMRWDDKASVDKDQFKKTDKHGKCHFSGKTNCGDAITRVRNFPGYYDSEILTIPYTNKSRMICYPIWTPDNVVVTLRLQRVEHPIPLFVKTAALNKSPQQIAGNNMTFAYDLFAGEWLPPFGDGKFADIEFTCNERERLSDGRNFCGETLPRYRSSMQVKFTGDDNGLVKMPSTTLTLRIREAPPEGYQNELQIWHQRSRNLESDDGYDESRNYCFRIRTRKGKDGNIVEAYYGKIYRDFKISLIATNRIPDITGVEFSYYLNRAPLDRNLEFDTKRNLNKKEPIPPCALLTP